MLKRLIGITAALGLLVVAQTADAGGPRNPLQRVHQVARLAPGSAVRQPTPKVRVTTQQTRPTRAMIKKPGADRIHYMDGGSTGVRVVRNVVVRRTSEQESNTFKAARVRPFVRCTDSTACGNGSSAARSATSTARAEHRLMTAEQASDPIAQKRQRLRDEMRAKMARAKAIAAKYKGK